MIFVSSERDVVSSLEHYRCNKCSTGWEDKTLPDGSHLLAEEPMKDECERDSRQ